MRSSQSIGTVPVPEELVGRVRLYRVDLDAPEYAEVQTTLSADEEARADALGAGAPARRYRAAHHALRAILGADLGRDGQALDLAPGRLGRPTVRGEPGLHFSLSHSEGVAAIAVASAPVGIDVEVLRPLPWGLPLAEEHCTVAELTWLRSAARAARDRALFTCWTQKEAVTKALGVGLALAPRLVETVGPSAPHVRLGERWWPVVVAEASLGDDVVAAVALTDAATAMRAEQTIATEMGERA